MKEYIGKCNIYKENTKDIVMIRLFLWDVNMNHTKDVNEIKSGRKPTPNDQITKIPAIERSC